MKNLIRNIWEAPASTIAGAITAALTYVIAADVELPTWALITMGATAAALAALSGNADSANK